MRPTANWVCFVTILGVGAAARAEPAPAGETVVATAAPASLDNAFSAFGILSYWYSESGLGLGLRYQKTLVKNQILKAANVHEEIALEGGLDYFHYGFSTLGYDWSYNEFVLLVGGVWNFWILDDRLALYPKIDLGYRFGSWSNSGIASPGGYGGVVFQVSAGAVYKLGKLALRGEVGSGSVRLGAAVTF